MSRSPRQVDSRFILILVDVVTVPVATTVVPGDDDDGGLEEHEGLVKILTGDPVTAVPALLRTRGFQVYRLAWDDLIGKQSRTSALSFTALCLY